MVLTGSLDFHVSQAQYVKLATERIAGPPPFRPDGLTPAQIANRLSEIEAALGDLLGKYSTLNVARGELESARVAGHDASVSVYACLKSCYRANDGWLASIKRLPKNDNTAPLTSRRMQAISELWATLPPPPGGGAFQAGAITEAAFNALFAKLQDKLSAYRDANSQFVAQQTVVRQLDEQLGSFVTAAMVQGRASYKEGTADRAYIDAVPAEPSGQLPAQAFFSVKESQAVGAVHLSFDADNATSFAVYHKAPGQSDFTRVGDSLRPGDFVAFGLPAGQHTYQVVGHNSRGDGPPSEAATLTVATAAAA